ncbi:MULTISPECIES: Eco47II family restriction endonuclease [Enterococcus]|uniref:Eco47II family restriction endonuclease n=1 Tax=Enterococcus TaxID=1350 RepID=UPI001E388B09|nr:Eco47II family restriction endonuclease [Enterococcus gallinarum]MCD5076307.1 Eco47II family restriction endonuclease [Enterococcus gallinarum]MDO6299534.1 Eco47II family restriction endonuclease [Enterococcus gallinarum]
MANTYLSFISDEDLFECIEFLYLEYEKALQGIDYQKFFKNRIDTFKMTFDTAINNLNEQSWLAAELQRQVEKTITNHVGTFHEKLIGKIEGFNNYPVGQSYDVANDDKTIFAEIKNKHNTVTGTHVLSLFEKIKRYADAFPDATCYYVRIIDTKSRNEIWKFRSGASEPKPLYSHPRIRIISGDKFYELVTGKQTAFQELCEIMPKALQNWISTRNARQGSSMGLFADLYQQSQNNKRTLFEEIIYINYPLSKYIGFSSDGLEDINDAQLSSLEEQ